MAITWANTWVAISNAVKLVDDQRANFAGSFLTQLQVAYNDTPNLNNGPPGSTSGPATTYSNALAFVRGIAAQFLATGATWLAPLLLQAVLLTTPKVSTPTNETIFAFLINYFISSGYRIQSRLFTRGTWTAGGSNTGNGTIERLLVDPYGTPLEASFADVVSFFCNADRQSGTLPGQEVFLVTGQPSVDPLQYLDATRGAGTNTAIVGISGDTTQSIAPNPSFSQATGTSFASDFALTNWTTTLGGSATAADTGLDTTNYYRPCALEGTTPASLKINARAASTWTYSQKLSTGNKSLAAALAYFSQIAVNRQIGAGTGTVTLTIGSKSVSISLAAQTGWQLLRFGSTTYGGAVTDQWFQNFDTNDLTISIAITCTAGYILIDDYLFAPYLNIDGVQYAAVGGSTFWKYRDTGTITDTEPAQSSAAASGKIQRWLRWSFGQCLPSTAPAPTAAPSAALAGAGAGNVTNGTHVYAYTNVDALGVEGPPSAASAAVNVVNNAADGKVAVTGILAGPSGTASRKVYRSATGTTTPLLLLTTIADNVTTTYTDNTADGSLGAGQPPTFTLLADPS